MSREAFEAWLKDQCLVNNYDGILWAAWQAATAAANAKITELEEIAYALEAILQRAGEGATVVDVLDIVERSKAATPAGYRLVPEVPTNEMTSAMAYALEDPENERSSWDLAENIYRVAMLQAAKESKT